MDNNNFLETVLNAYNERWKENSASPDRIRDLDETVEGGGSNELGDSNSIVGRQRPDIEKNFKVEQKCQSTNLKKPDVIVRRREKKPVPVKPKRKNKSLFMSDLDLGEPLSVQSIIDSVRENSGNFEAVSTKDFEKTVELSGDANDTNNNPNSSSDNDARPFPSELPSEIDYESNHPSSTALEEECMKFLTSDSWLDDTESTSDRGTLICSDESSFLSDNASEPGFFNETLSATLRRKRQSNEAIDPTAAGFRSDHSSAEDSKRLSDSFAPSSNLMKHGALSVSVQSELDAVGESRYKKFQRTVSSRYKGKNKSRPLRDDKNVRKELSHMFDAAATNAYAKLQKIKKIKLKTSSQNDTTDSSAPKVSSKQCSSNGWQGRSNNKSMDKQQSEDEDFNARRNSNSSCSLASLGGTDKSYEDESNRVLKSGWLRKQGGMIKTWNERWFVLRGDRLYYYKDKDVNKVLGIIPLQGNHIIEHHNRTNDPGKFYFEIIPGGDRENLTKNHNTYLLSADSQSTVNEWVKLITRAMKSPPGGGVFGQELWRLIKHEKVVDNKLSPSEGRTREVPYVIEACCDFILENDVFNEEGLFRLPGQANEVKDLQHSFDMGVRPTFDKSTDPHTVASLMKSFFRELPEPLVPYDKYVALIEAAKTMMPSGLPSFNKSYTSEPEEGDYEKVSKAREMIKKQLESLPRDNFRLLRYLCRFLNKVQQHSTKNKMDVANLALMFGPNIIKSKKEEDPRIIMEHTTYVQHIMSEFIRNHNYLLPDDENVTKKSSVPDVVPDAISCENTNSVMTSPMMSSQCHNFTDTVVSSHTTQTTSTEGFNTISTTTSPPGTFNSNRHHTDDSGTGSLGPTPDNTSRRNIANAAPKMRSDAHSNRHKPVSAILEEDGVTSHSTTPNKPKVPSKPPRPQKDPHRRESFYDNVTPPSETRSFGNPAQTRYRDRNSGHSSPLYTDLVRNSQSVSNGNVSGDKNTNQSPRSSYGNQVSPSASTRSSTNAVAGSSVAGSTLSGEFEAFSPYSATLSPQEHDVDRNRISVKTTTESSKGPKPPMRRKRSKKTGAKVTTGAQENPLDNSDEESNTESVPPDDRSDSRFRLSSRQSSFSSINEPGQNKQLGNAKRPTQRPPPPPYPSQHPRFQGRNPPSTTTDSSVQPTYSELQNNIRTLQTKLVKQTDEFEMRTRYLEESFMKQIHELRISTSSFVADSSVAGVRTPSRISEFETPSGYWRRTNSRSNNEDAFSYEDSITDTVSESIRFDSVHQRYDLDSKISHPKEFKSLEEEVEYLQKCVSEERKLREMTEIQLKNEKRGREMAEERNVHLQKEMREFFCTFGSMFSNSETSSVQ